MVRTKDELLNAINEIVGEENNDAVIALIEDVTDTITDFEGRVGTADEWRQKYEENDAEWRQKYRDRFMNGDTSSEDVPVADVDAVDGDIEPDGTVVTYDELFDKGEK